LIDLEGQEVYDLPAPFYAMKRSKGGTAFKKDDVPGEKDARAKRGIIIMNRVAIE